MDLILFLLDIPLLSGVLVVANGEVFPVRLRASAVTARSRGVVVTALLQALFVVPIGGVSTRAIFLHRCLVVVRGYRLASVTHVVGGVVRVRLWVEVRLSVGL